MTKCRKHGELTPDLIKANGRCKLCHRETANTKRDNNREWFNAKIAEDKLKHPEKWQDIYKRHYQNRINRHGHSIRNSQEIARRRGISRSVYEELFDKQNHKCAICNKEETRMIRGKISRLALDHCHKTNKVRELLCHNCNSGLGKFFENITVMQKAIKYLRKHNGG
jgi:hypothetical protein